jgi:hypothetical protein
MASADIRQARLGTVSRKTGGIAMPKGFVSERELNMRARDLRICNRARLDNLDRD